MKILITGVPGWLGNRFLGILSQGFNGDGPANDWAVRCLVLPGTSLTALKQLAGRKEVEYVEGDVTRPETLDKALNGIDIVFHLAGIIHPSKIGQLFDVNAAGTKNMLEKSVQHRVGKFIYISSNSVAGSNLRHDVLMREEDAARPYKAYGESKFLAEQAVRASSDSRNMGTVILRPCWYYGPNQPERQTFFFRMIKKGNPIIFGNGENLRSMSYVDNTCSAMLLAAQKPEATGQTYWIADAQPYTSNEIYHTISELLEVKNFKPRYLPDLVSAGCRFADTMIQAAGLYIKEIHVAGEMNMDIACSIEKAQRELGYDPQVALREGMRRSIEWCRSHGMVI
jgi:nucleoside-diphosphate-sugar epimerase